LAESSHKRVATISDFFVEFTNTLSPELGGHFETKAILTVLNNVYIIRYKQFHKQSVNRKVQRI